jgi:hypothetical protein
MTTEMLSPNFSLYELTHSDTAERKGIDNTPSKEITERLRLVANRLEEVRRVLGVPIHISSGYRCPNLNKLVGGAKASAHMDGWAVDIQCKGLTPKQVCAKVIAAEIPVDKIIEEGSWTHISFDPRLRGQKLTATFNNGVASYTNGIEA